jgi:hypothetical protein
MEDYEYSGLGWTIMYVGIDLIILSNGESDRARSRQLPICLLGEEEDTWLPPNK